MVLAWAGTDVQNRNMDVFTDPAAVPTFTEEVNHQGNTHNDEDDAPKEHEHPEGAGIVEKAID